LGAKGIVRPGGDALQVVLGPIADQVVEEIRAARTLSTRRADSVLAKTIVRTLEPAGIRSVELRGSRLLIDLERPLQLSGTDLDALGTRGWVLVDGGVQLIIGPDAEVVAEVLSARSR
jgi:PTS system N-acetylglucosamine-specific IIC component